jgi:protein-tyrosine phosphatase
MNTTAVLFVCMGNICRSPTAHGVFRKLVEQQGLREQIRVDSAGTHSYHIHEPPDTRSTEAAAKRGVDIRDLRARKVNADDFRTFDYILAMDRDNLAILEGMCPPDYDGELRLFLDYASDDWRTREVPDPYYGGQQGFSQVLSMVEDAAHGLLQAIQHTVRS